MEPEGEKAWPEGAPAFRSGLWKVPFSRGELEGLLRAMLRAAGLPKGEAELILIADDAMERLHGQSLGRAGPTNILSFPLGPGAPLLGSLALSPDTLLRECFLYGQEPRGHCIRLLAHGLAHLMGHEHGRDMLALCAKMERAAKALAGKKWPE